MMKFDKVELLTPTEYARDLYIDRILTRLGNRVQSVCDIGCGVGNLLAVFEDRLPKAKGIDLSEDSLRLAAAKIASPRIEFEKKDASELNEKFDLVFLTDVLEHMQNDRSFLKLLHDRVVNPGGYLLITIPAHSRLYSAFDRKGGHYRRYDKSPFLKMFDECGFKPELCWSYGQFIFHIAVNMTLLFENKPAYFDGGSIDSYLGAQTRVSAVREFPGITRVFISRVNILHKMFFVIDDMLKNLDLGIQYLVLGRSR